MKTHKEMKKLLALILFFGLTLQMVGQLNPINNLTWHQWYQTPHNFFDLNWESPDSSSDTLVGYNIYRNSELYRFQTDLRLYHTENGENCPENFLFLSEFWIHVTAVYNSTLEESVYIDSVFTMGPVLGIEKTDLMQRNLFPNPTTGKLNINYERVKKIIIYNRTGQVLKELKPEPQIDLSSQSLTTR